MLIAVFKIMWLRLWRDKGALVLAFILPGFIFAIFAAIFSNAAGGELDLRVSMALENKSEASEIFVDRVRSQASFSLSYDPNWTAHDITTRVRLGQDDVGFVITGNPSDLSTPPIHIISDPGRVVAATVLKGQLREIWAKQAGATQAAFFEDISTASGANTRRPKDPSVIYYIGATAILFLLFSAMQGAALTLEERNSGIADRLMMGRTDAFSWLLGKFVFLVVTGALQAAIIVGVAHIFFDVEIITHVPSLIIACLGAAAISAALALLLASLCESAAQMHAISTFIVLLFSALGGSMVPRFMMPEGLQAMSIFTPNYWVIEAFYGTLARGQSFMDLLLIWVILFGTAVICLFAAAFISHKLMRT